MDINDKNKKVDESIHFANGKKIENENKTIKQEENVECNKSNIQTNVSSQNPYQYDKNKEKKNTYIIVLFICGIVLVLGIVFWGFVFTMSHQVINRYGDNYKHKNPIGNISNVKDIDEKENCNIEKSTKINKSTKRTLGEISIIDVSSIVDEVMPSMVSITINTTENVSIPYLDTNLELETDVEGYGSGIIIGKDEKYFYIITNQHVVDGVEEANIQFVDDSECVGIVRNFDKNNDLAIIMVEVKALNETTMNKIKIATFGDSDDLVVGEGVVAIGNAMGIGQCVSTGIISATNKKIDVEDKYSMEFIQTDAAINPGNSGGALINSYGEIIGINESKVVLDGIEGIGFAIPVSNVKDSIENMINSTPKVKTNRANKGYLGVSCLNVSDELHNVYHIPLGVYVQNVEIGSSADKANIESGDIILSVDGENLTTTKQLIEYLSYCKNGDVINLVISRLVDGEYKSFEQEVTLSDIQFAIN